jgi:hypothetical protein
MPSLPPHLTSFTYGPCFELPEYGVHCLHRKFHHSLEGVKLPDTIKYLDISSKEPFCEVGGWNYPLDNVHLPKDLQTLLLSRAFNHPIQHIKLPPYLTNLSFSEEGTFNQPIESLRFPYTLHTLQFSSSFNHPIDKIRFPPVLTYLKFGSYFNHPLPLLPSSLTELSFGNSFNQPIQKIIFPPALTALYFGLDFNQPLPILPSSLSRLCLGKKFSQSSSNLSEAIFNTTIKTFRLPPRISGSLEELCFPPSLTHLEYNSDNSLQQLSLPPSIIKLCLSPSSFDNTISLADWDPPVGIIDLEIVLLSNIENAFFPPRLSRLKLSSLDGPIPSNIHWPTSLTYLDIRSMSGKYSIPFPRGSLPNTLVEFILPSSWNLRYTKDNLYLPSTLLHLTIPSLSIIYFQDERVNQIVYELISILPPRLDSLVVLCNRAFVTTNKLCNDGSLVPSSSSSSSSTSSSSCFSSFSSFCIPSRAVNISLPPSLTQLRLYKRQYAEEHGWLPFIHEKCRVQYSN